MLFNSWTLRENSLVYPHLDLAQKHFYETIEIQAL